MKDNRDAGHSPRIPRKKKRRSAREGGKRKKMIEIEKKRQTIPIIQKDTGMSRSDPAFWDDHIRGIRWNTRYYDDVFNSREHFSRGCDV